MQRKRKQFSIFIPRSLIHKQSGYILVTALIVLLLVTTVIIYQYHYYAGYRKLEAQIVQDYYEKIENNLKAVHK